MFVCVFVIPIYSTELKLMHAFHSVLLLDKSQFIFKIKVV